MKNKHSKQGFSLIELMVVIAIVAVLTAVAYPYYKKYVFASKTAGIVKVADSLRSKMIEYATIHGHFPNLTELGMDEYGTNAKSLDPNLLRINFLDYNMSDPEVCGRSGSIYLNIDPAAFWQLEPLQSAVAQYYCYLWHINGVINTKCFFNARKNTFIPGPSAYYDSSTSISYRDFIPGVGGEYYENGGSFRFNSTYGQATCM